LRVGLPRISTPTRSASEGVLLLSRELLHPPPVHLGDEQIPLRIRRQHVRRLELPRFRSFSSPGIHYPSLVIELENPVGQHVGDKHCPVPINLQSIRRKTLPDLQYPPLAVENLNAFVFAVADEDTFL